MKAAWGPWQDLLYLLGIDRPSLSQAGFGTEELGPCCVAGRGLRLRRNLCELSGKCCKATEESRAQPTARPSRVFSWHSRKQSAVGNVYIPVPIPHPFPEQPLPQRHHVPKTAQQSAERGVCSGTVLPPSFLCSIDISSEDWGTRELGHEASSSTPRVASSRDCRHTAHPDLL